MKQDIMKAVQKRPYEAPSLFIICLAPARMLANSGDDPKVYTTSEKASTDYDALVKGQNSTGIWDDEW